MAKVVWTEPALQDLDEIAEYIALDKLSAAKKLVEKVGSSGIFVGEKLPQYLDRSKAVVSLQPLTVNASQAYEYDRR